VRKLLQRVVHELGIGEAVDAIIGGGELPETRARSFPPYFQKILSFHQQVYYYHSVFGAMCLLRLIIPILVSQLFEQFNLRGSEFSTPSPRQLAWQEREVEGLIHFGINTFTGQEWGSGSESPSLFNPTNLSADEWVSSAKAFNAKSIILVAKHHDGFCLWPSKYTDYSIKKSPWKNANAISRRASTDVYDAENHLISRGTISIVYDHEGNRGSKTVGTTTTLFLVDTQNTSGYKMEQSLFILSQTKA
jgi:hypothetical protein